MFRDRMFRHERFGRASRRSMAFRKGDLKFVILSLLQESPRHGYDIIRELEDRSEGLYKPSPGVIYPTLQMLEEMGYTTSREEEGKKVSTITEEGEKFLAEKKDATDGMKERIKKRWSFRNIGRMAGVMRDYHALEHVISDGIRSLDEDKAGRIREILSQTARDIEDIFNE
jgi:DNA-binding PadR family transcriptional regulator